jgi:transcriptional regulator
VTHLSTPHAWSDEAAMRAFVATQAFAQISCVAGSRVVPAHAPLSLAPDGSVRFHLARGNPAVAWLDGSIALATVIGAHGYISPDWYGSEDQVPTWNYSLVAIEGAARRLDADELRVQVDAVSDAQEALLAPKPAWTSAKMDPRTLRLMLRAIVGFAIEQPVWRGTRKLGRNKSPAERDGAIAGLRGQGRDDLADAMAMS